MTSAKSHENVTFIKCFGLFRAGHIWAAGVNLSLCCTKLLGHVVLNFLVSCWGPCPGIWLDISKFLLPRWITHFHAGSTFLLLAFVVNSWKGFATCRRYVLDTRLVEKFGFQRSTFMRHRNLNWKCSRQHICQNVLPQLIKIFFAKIYPVLYAIQFAKKYFAI